MFVVCESFSTSTMTTEEVWKKGAYVKDNSIVNVTPLQAYSDGSEKMIYYSSFNKRVFLGRGAKFNNIEGKYGIQYKMGFTREEFVALCNVMSSFDTSAPSPFYQIATGKNWKKQMTRLICAHDANGNLAIMRQYMELPKDPEPAQPIEYDDDPDPIDKATLASVIREGRWVDEFEKFWISKKDPWKKMCKEIRKFLREVRTSLYADDLGHEIYEKVDLSDDEESVDVVPPTPTPSVDVPSSDDDETDDQRRKSPRKKLSVEKAIENSKKRKKSTPTTKTAQPPHYKRVRKEVNMDIALLILFDFMTQILTLANVVHVIILI